MKKILTCLALIATLNVHNVYSMQEEVSESTLALAQALYTKPSESFELIHAFVAARRSNIDHADASTGNTWLHVEIINLCWGQAPARLITIAALLAHGADRTRQNSEELTPAACANDALYESTLGTSSVFTAHAQAALDLLQEEKPTKQTLINLAKKHKLTTLMPLLTGQHSNFV
ncbi:MAG: hypothetical protein AB7F19_02120 [Candidatus Babeliales bacterium]